MAAKFLLHKVNNAKYWYVSQQKRTENTCYRHNHVGSIKPYIGKNKNGSIINQYIFSPNMKIFSLSKEDIKRLKSFIDSNFKNTVWKLDYNFIKGGVEVHEEVTSTEKKQTVKKEELVYQK